MSRGKGGKVKRSPGTWFDREMILSPAYVDLPKVAYPILSMVLLKRQFPKGGIIAINRNDITITYKELKALGMKGNTTIANGFKALISHGFIKVVSQGGAHQGEKSVYGLSDDWRNWKRGAPPVQKKEKGRQSGSDAFRRHRESKKGEQEKEDN